MEQTLRFVVMGDTHYVQPEAHKEVFAGRAKGITEYADVTRNYWMTQHVLPQVVTSIAELKPDFVIQTGDIIQGHCDDAAGGLREMEEALGLLNKVGAPLFFALGTHDGTYGKPGDEPVRQLVYPAIGRSLGNAVSRSYYRFEKGRSLFVILDYTTFASGDEQSRFIEEALRDGERYEHVFVFAHPPLLPVGRPFFTKFGFAAAVLDAISRYPVDAYFCGHTHNQISSLHQVGERWLPQLKSTVLGYTDREPARLQDVRPLLPEPDSFEFGWGFLEDSMPGWWLVTVEGDSVTADWHVLGQGVVGQMKWRSGQKAAFTRVPDISPSPAFDPGDLDRIREVRLRAAGECCFSPGVYRVYLNGTEVGTLPPLAYFDCRQLLTLERKYWPLLGQSNVLTVKTGDEEMCIGGFVLEADTDSGCVRSSVSGYYSNTSRWDRWGHSPVHAIDKCADVTVELFFTKEHAKV